MNGRTLKLTVRKTALQAKGSMVINTLQSGAKLSSELIISNDPLTNRLTIYLDSEEKKNQAGLIETIEDENGSTLVQEELREILKIGYKAEAVGLGGQNNTYICKFTEILPDAAGRGSSGDFSDEVERIVNAGYCTQSDLMERIQVMTDLRIPDSMIVDILKQYRNYKKPVKRPRTIYVDAYPKDEPIIRNAIINIMVGRPQIFEGPKSVGKNVAIETIAWLLNKPLYMDTYNRYMCNDDIYGSKTTKAPDINGYSIEQLKNMAQAKVKIEALAINGDIAAFFKNETQSKKKEDDILETIELACEFDAIKAKAAAVQIEQEESQLVSAIEDGGLYCANEFNLAETNFAAGIMNQLTDGTGFITAPGRGRVNVSPDFCIIATQNNGYAGTCEQNSATMSRFGCLEFKFPGSVKSQLEAAVGKKNLDKKYFTQCDTLYKAFLDAVTQGMVQDDCLNIRGFVAALKAVAKYPDYTKLAKQLEIQVVSTCPETDRVALFAQISDKISL